MARAQETLWERRFLENRNVPPVYGIEQTLAVVTREPGPAGLAGQGGEITRDLQPLCRRNDYVGAISLGPPLTPQGVP